MKCCMANDNGGYDMKKCYDPAEIVVTGILIAFPALVVIYMIMQLNGAFI